MGVFNGPGKMLMSQIRSTVNGFLPDMGTIQSFAAVSDGAGGFTEQWTPVTSGTVSARVLPMTYSQVEVLSAAEGVRVEYIVVLPYDAPINVGNRISTGGAAYNVRTMQPMVSNVAFVKAYCSRDV